VPNTELRPAYLIFSWFSSVSDKKCLNLFHHRFTASATQHIPFVSRHMTQVCETDWLTYLLTPCKRVLLAKLTGFHLVRKFPAFYGTRRFITRSIQSISLHPTSWISILISSSHLRFCLPSGFFHSFPHQNAVYTSPLRPYVLHVPPISLFWIWSPEKYWVRSTDH